MTQGKCVNTKTDKDNCGGCGKKCAKNQVCQDGNCTVISIFDQGPPAHVFCSPPCLPGEICVFGQCQKPGEVDHFACELLCAPEACCNMTCIDTTSDPNNCGSCGNICAAGTTCCAGACVNLLTNWANCGACMNTCLAVQDCCAGSCLDVWFNPASCGGCGNVCAPNNPNCCFGQCTNRQTDVHNCGVCTTECPSAHACCAGACQPICASNLDCEPGQLCDKATGCCAVFGPGTPGLPASDTWSPTSTEGAPAPRTEHRAVWTGSRMFVWGGGVKEEGHTSTGGLYDPASDTWTPTSTKDAPAPKANYPPPLWTGDRAIVAGGDIPGSPLGPSGLYDPEPDTWTPIDLDAAPEGFYVAAAAWAGCRAIFVGSQYNVEDQSSRPAAWAYEPAPLR
ncbi:MAG: hypothetical protein HY744_02935 [Deltaproteobacteria bacterium]|nr:hypothetical protein [Deltaproteobacteria bacterium]